MREQLRAYRTPEDTRKQRILLPSSSYSPPINFFEFRSTVLREYRREACGGVMQNSGCRQGQTCLAHITSPSIGNLRLFAPAVSKAEAELGLADFSHTPLPVG